jgi:hypothetical protein
VIQLPAVVVPHGNNPARSRRQSRITYELLSKSVQALEADIRDWIENWN